MARQTPMLATPPEYDEDTRNSILALIAAGRELGPEMDTALAESYLTKQRASRAEREHLALQRRQERADRRATLYAHAGRAILLIAALGAFAALAYFSDGRIFFFFWPLFIFGGVIFRGRRRWGDPRGGRGYSRYDRWNAHRDWRSAGDWRNGDHSTSPEYD